MRFIFYVATAISIVSSGCRDHQVGGKEKQPNIIFIMADDHAIQALSCYGSRFIETSNIDKLAAEGMVFNRAFVTNSICAPSRAVILSGKHSHLNGVRDNHNRFDSCQVSFPRILQEGGYQTALVGKWHLKSQPGGFDYWNILPGQGDYYNPKFINNGSDTTYHGYVTDIITDLGLQWISSLKNKEPFLLMVHHKAPHRNWMPDVKHLDVFDGITFPQPASFHDDYYGREHLHQQKLTIARHMDVVYDLKIPCDTCPVADVNQWARSEYRKQIMAMDTIQQTAWNRGYQQEINHYDTSSFTSDQLVNWKYQRYLQDYLRCILSIDENVGRILKYLDQQGLADHTVVVYTSDQGFFLGEHGLFDKRYMYEESLRTPLVIKYPERIKPGLICNELVQNLDIAPTILEMAGMDMPDEMQGRSMYPLFRAPAQANWRDAVYYHFYESGWGVPQHYGIRTQSHKLIHFLSEPDNWELYDLVRDPHEMVNLYDDPANDELIQELKQELEELRIVYMVPERPGI
jgi:arylsulfatase A-like enzyme